MRFLGLDIGEVRIGVALSDESGTIASPLTTVAAKQPYDAIAAEFRAICEENEVRALVVGLPFSMSGGAGGTSARAAKTLGRKLAQTLGLKVAFADERFTTALADRALLEADVNRKKRKTVVDKVAAALMLQTFLDGRRNRDA